MAVNNGNMILCTIDAMQLKEDECILEIGPGGGSHVGDLMSRAENLNYTGIEISQLMVEEAAKLNADYIDAGSVRFELSNGEKIDFPDEKFDKVFSVNTIYFWRDPKSYAAEIFRVLKPGGKLSLGFAARDFMETLPFTSYKFNLYNVEEVQGLLKSAGFELDALEFKQEHITSNGGDSVLRTFIILNASA